MTGTFANVANSRALLEAVSGSGSDGVVPVSAASSSTSENRVLLQTALVDGGVLISDDPVVNAVLARDILVASSDQPEHYAVIQTAVAESKPFRDLRNGPQANVESINATNKAIIIAASSPQAAEAFAELINSDRFQNAGSVAERTQMLNDFVNNRNVVPQQTSSVSPASGEVTGPAETRSVSESSSSRSSDSPQLRSSDAGETRENVLNELERLKGEGKISEAEYEALKELVAKMDDEEIQTFAGALDKLNEEGTGRLESFLGEASTKKSPDEVMSLIDEVVGEVEGADGSGDKKSSDDVKLFGGKNSGSNDVADLLIDTSELSGGKMPTNTALPLNP